MNYVQMDAVISGCQANASARLLMISLATLAIWQLKDFALNEPMIKWIFFMV